MKQKRVKIKMLVIVLAGAILLFAGICLFTTSSNTRELKNMYCYYYDEDSVSTMYLSKSEECFYQMLVYYYCTNISKEKGFIFLKNVYSINDILCVKVLEYSNDSLMTKIHYKYFTDMRGGMIMDAYSYVPSFCLYDTIPKYSDCINEKYMNDDALYDD